MAFTTSTNGMVLAVLTKRLFSYVCRLLNNLKGSRHFLRLRRRLPRSSSKLVNVRVKLTSFYSTCEQLSTDRVQRLKDARSEALKEIEVYKQAKESEYRSFELTVRSLIPARQSPDCNALRLSEQHAGTTSDAQMAVDKETELKLRAITNSYEQAKDTVVEKLLARVTLVNPELHRNLKKIEA